MLIISKWVKDIKRKLSHVFSCISVLLKHCRKDVFFTDDKIEAHRV